MIRRKLVVLSLVSFVLALAVGAGATPRDEVVRNFDKTLPLAAGRAFRLSHQFGNVKVQGAAVSEARIHAIIHASAETAAESQKLADAIQIAIGDDGGGISVRTIYPDKSRTFLDWLSGKFSPSFSVDYDITVPETSPLTVGNDFGNVDVSGLKAGVDVTDAHGKLSVSDTKGDTRVENKFGAAEITGVGGSLAVTNTNGAVVVNAVDGLVTVGNRFGDVTISRARKGATVTNGNGKVNVSDSGGSVSVTDSFGAVVVTGATGSVTVSNRNGAVEVRTAGGAAEVSNSFGDVTVSDVTGRVAVTNTNARVSVSGAKGAAVVQGGFGEIVVRDVQGDLEVQNHNAAVTVERVGGAADVRNSFGRVEVRHVGRGVKATNNNGDVVVADADGSVYAKTSFGLIQADRVGGLRAENANGAIRASAVKGPADVQTSFASIDLAGVDGDVTVRGQNGAVEVSGLGSKVCHRVIASTSFAPIRLTLPAAVGFNVSAKTSFGRIDNQMPITTTGMASSDAVSGMVAGGGCEVTLSNANGNITLASAPRKP